MDSKALQDSGKYLAAIVSVPIIGILLYLGAVLSVYILAGILGLFGEIFL